MSARILFVDDEYNVLEGLKRQFRKHYDIHTASSGAAALRLIEREEPFAVIVSDMRMPAMTGAEFLREARRFSPDSVRLLLTGNADQQTAIEAVNEGNVFSILIKPSSREAILAALGRAIQQYELVTAERELLKGTLNGSVKLLIDMLAMVAPELFGQATSVRVMAADLGKTMNLQSTWSLELAAMLANLAAVTLPPETVTRHLNGAGMRPEELDMLRRLPEIGRNLISNIPRLHGVAEIVFYHQKNFDGSGFPDDGRAGADIPIESRILKVLYAVQALMRDGISVQEGLSRMARDGGRYDPIVLQSAFKILADTHEFSSAAVAVDVTVHGLRAGHVLVSNIETVDGRLLIAAGHKITQVLQERLFNYHRITKIREPIKVITVTHTRPTH